MTLLAVKAALPPGFIIGGCPFDSAGQLY